MIEHPWTRETLDLGPLIAWRFSFELEASPEELWPILIDTDRLDRAMGLPLIAYAELDGLLRGASRVLGHAFQWTELPWAWVAEKEMRALRVYDSGIATHLAIAFFLVPSGADGTRLDLRFAWYLRSALARPLVALGERHARGVYRRALARLDRLIAEDRPRHLLRARRPPALGREVQQRLADLRGALRRDGVRGAVIDALFSHVERADDTELRRIRALPLARRWRIAGPGGAEEPRAGAHAGPPVPRRAARGVPARHAPRPGGAVDPRATDPAPEGGASLSPAAPPQRFGCGVRRRYGRTAL